MNECTVRQTFKLIDLGIHTELLPEDAFTLDELHKIFESFEDIDLWPEFFFTRESQHPCWTIVDDNAEVEFPRTKNHAEDWATIAIWLLENEHIDKHQVNEALA